jgi:hypothetical protein
MGGMDTEVKTFCYILALLMALPAAIMSWKFLFVEPTKLSEIYNGITSWVMAFGFFIIANHLRA